MQLNVRHLIPTDLQKKQYRQCIRSRDFPPERTAVIVCDMWQDHWCKGAARRVAEMAPRLNQVLRVLRAQGVTIAHAPSDTMDFYKEHPARIRTLQEAGEADFPEVPGAEEIRNREGELYIDRHAVQCDCGVGLDQKCPPYRAWYRQIEALEIEDTDLIGDGIELLKAFRARGIRHVIMTGVHTNRCILNRPYGIKALVCRGFDVVLMRDLTDCLAPRDEIPYTDHFTALDLILWHIEKYWCGTITSDQVLHDDRPFRFCEDRRRTRYPYRNYRLLQEDAACWQRVREYVEPIPNPDYTQAPEAALEAFRQIRYSVRVSPAACLDPAQQNLLLEESGVRGILWDGPFRPEQAASFCETAHRHGIRFGLCVKDSLEGVPDAVDFLCFPDESRPEDWLKLRSLVYQARSLREDRMMNCGGIGSYGDFYTEDGGTSANHGSSDLPWERLCHLSTPEACLTPSQVIRLLQDTVSEGGNLTLILNTENGWICPEEADVLKKAGRQIQQLQQMQRSNVSE